MRENRYIRKDYNVPMASLQSSSSLTTHFKSLFIFSKRISLSFVCFNWRSFGIGKYKCTFWSLLRLYSQISSYYSQQVVKVLIWYREWLLSLLQGQLNSLCVQTMQGCWIWDVLDIYLQVTENGYRGMGGRLFAYTSLFPPRSSKSVADRVSSFTITWLCYPLTG